MNKNAKGQGYGKHLKEEIYEIGRTDLKSLSTILGSKKFFFGDKPCDLDPAVFGVLVQFVYTEKGPLHHYMNCKRKVFLIGSKFKIIYSFPKKKIFKLSAKIW